MIHKYIETVGDDTHQGFVIEHGLHTREVVVSVYDAKTGDDLAFRVNTAVTSLDEVLVDTSFLIIYDPENHRIDFAPGWTPEKDQLKVVVLG
jgi:hypothetical protein